MSSRVYTLPTLTPGTWQKLQLPADTVAFMFKNDSVYDFLIVFGGTLAPSFTTSPGGQANAFVNALEYPVVYVQRPGASQYEQQLNAVGAWDGNLWYLCQDNTGGLATTGTISGRVVVNIQTYGPLDDVPPSGQAVTRQVDLTSQPRIIEIPMTPTFSFSNSLAATTGADAGFFPDVIAFLMPGSDTGFVLYVYYLQVSVAATDGNLAFSLRMRVKDANTFAILQTNDIIYGWCGKTGNIGQPWVFAPANPMPSGFIRGSNLPANAGVIELDIHVFSSSVAALPFHATILADSDRQTPGQDYVPGIGGGLAAVPFGGGVPKF